MKYHPLLKEFWRTINLETKSDYCTINNCGIAAKDLLDWLENEKKIGFAERIPAGIVRNGKNLSGGFIQLDNSELIPHSWVQLRGEILDPSGFTPERDGQFDKLIRTENQMERVSRYKIFNSKGINVSESKINEYFAYSKYYTIWGWIKPDGKLVFPSKKQRENQNVSYDHLTFYAPVTDYAEAYASGYVRFFIENNKLTLEYILRTPVRTVIDGFRNIDRVLFGEEYNAKLVDIFGKEVKIPEKILIICHKDENSDPYKAKEDTINYNERTLIDVVMNNRNPIYENTINEKTYSSYKLSAESAEMLSQWITDSEIIEPVAKEDLHITITNSEETVDIIPSEKTIILKKEDFVIGSLGRALVLFVESEELEKIHTSAIEAGADSKYEKFIPHISLSYNMEANENIFPLLFPPDFDIVLSHEEVIHESFEMGEYYSFWGWIKSGGDLLLPTSKMRTDPEKKYNHKSLLTKMKSSPSLIAYTDALDKGMIRFSVDNKGVLEFELSNKCNVDTITKGYRNIENYLYEKENKDEIKLIFDRYEIFINEFAWELYTEKNMFGTYGNKNMFKGSSLRELINKIREYELETKIKEDIPANSTANIPVVPMPMTFKMFRRKKITEK